jgi:hypothetical protein
MKTERDHIADAITAIQKAIIATPGGARGSAQLRRLQMIRNDLRVAQEEVGK